MLITLSRRTAICESVAEVYLTGVAPLEAVSNRFNFNLIVLMGWSLLPNALRPFLRSIMFPRIWELGREHVD